ncbi:ABC transporter substrate-binding protein [Desulfoluna spongiiphila]|uniref:ABC transporter substrate-binding protein n=1 Tax=Desulfoluna spongiiphila TaxID=419481 RepID=UPI001257035E|nr:ABC transporter substrate-binding protein [Desulfoluna spongiiphila]VVS93439.1 ssua/thi5-like [Desulfoluna spongiiphila]
MHLLGNGKARHGQSLLLGALCVLLGPICARALESVSLQLKWTHHVQFAGYYAALEKGFYEEEGLAVTLLEGGSPEQGSSPGTPAFQYGIGFYGDTLVTTGTEVRRHPDRVRRFARASVKGWRYAFDHPGEVMDLCLERHAHGPVNLSREELTRELEEMKRLLQPGQMDPLPDSLVRIGLTEAGYEVTGPFDEETAPLPFDWTHWGVRTGGLALILAVSGGICLCFYNRRMRAEICRRIQSEEEREQLITELTQALEEVRELNGLLPICSSCFKVRNDKGYWEKLESYIESHTKARFSHGICTECMKERYPYLFDEEEGADGDADALYNEESGTLPSS